MTAWTLQRRQFVAGAAALADDADAATVERGDARCRVCRRDHAETACLHAAFAHESDLGAEALAQRGQGRDLAERGGKRGS